MDTTDDITVTVDKGMPDYVSVTSDDDLNILVMFKQEKGKVGVWIFSFYKWTSQTK